MNMTSMNISLPEPLKHFVEEQVSKGGYSTASEYLRELIREAQRRENRHGLEAKLLAGLQSPTSEMTVDDWAGLREDSVSKSRTSRRSVSRRIIRSDLALVKPRRSKLQYIRQHNPRAALRFLDAAEAMFRQLASMPGMGQRHETENPLYQELRCFPISKFPSHIVYYKPLADGIIVIHVLHGSRDVDQIFGQEGESERE